MKMIMDGGSLGAAATVISDADETKQEGGKVVSADGKFELSVKIRR